MSEVVVHTLDEIIRSLDRPTPRRRPRQLAGQAELALPTELREAESTEPGQISLGFDGA